MKRLVLGLVAGLACMGMLLSLGALPASAGFGTQTEPSQASIDRAHNFLKTAQRGRAVMDFVHFGSDYKGHRHVGTQQVQDRFGKRVPGHFALDVAYDWGNGGKTTLSFLCNERGDIYQIQVVDTNAGPLNQPFFTAELSIAVVGNIIINSFKDQLTPADRRFLQRCVDNADARSLSLWSVQLGQAFNR